MKLIILGVSQDSGYPQTACTLECCKGAWENPSLRNYAVSLALVDERSSEYFLFDVTPDFKSQLHLLYENYPTLSGKQPAGIFLSHAHIGHYTGLTHFSMEAMNTDSIPVYLMPRMFDFISKNAPWSQLVQKQNVVLNKIQAELPIDINGVQVIPFLVPHRDEFSETVAYKIIGSEQSILFIPDIDKWIDWDKDIIQEVAKVDLAFLDGSFYSEGELPGRDMTLIKHPYVRETMDIFSGMDVSEKRKISFIHLNHTNPLLNPNSDAFKSVRAKGFNIAKLGEKYTI